MKKVYEIRKVVVANSCREAILNESKGEITQAYIVQHSQDILLDDLHHKKNENKT